jgi:hypothetical protein
MDSFVAETFLHRFQEEELELAPMNAKLWYCVSGVLASWLAQNTVPMAIVEIELLSLDTDFLQNC